MKKTRKELKKTDLTMKRDKKIKEYENNYS